MGAALPREEAGGLTLAVGKLVHFHGDVKTAEIRLDRQRTTIGRRPDNDICLAYPAVSGAHAAIVTILADSFLEDLGSTNGTLVNGTSVTKHFLRDRDQIDIGQEILVYLVDDEATLETLPASVRTPRGAGQDRGAAAPNVGSGGRVVTGAQHTKRRSDAAVTEPAAVAPVAPVTPDAPDALERSFAADFGGVVPETPAAAPAVGAAVAPASPSERQAEPAPALRVIDGAKAGRFVALVKDETLIGRTGVQVAALRRTAAEVRVVPVEGAHPPSVNGTPVAPEGQPLAAGDILEIAGTKLEVVTSARVPTA
jgi:pSer/pThr/pTyr-binding forkhead associated (FHA) protein